MRLRHIEVFQAVYVSGSMTQAAKRLNVSQPSISKVLAHAELQLGFNLFERAHGKLLPTPEAERLYPFVANLYASLGEVRRVATNLRESTEGKLRVASTPALSTRVMPELVATFLEHYPDVLFELETLHQAEIAAALLEARIDVGLVFQPTPMPGIQAQTVARRDIVLIAPPASNIVANAAPTIQALNGLPFVALHEKSPLGAMVQAELEAHHVQPSIVAIAETYHVARSLVARGLGVALVDELTANSAPKSDVQVHRLTSPLSFDIAVLQPADVPMPQMTKHFVKQLSEHFPKNDL